MSDPGNFGGPFNIPPGANDFQEQENDPTPWYRRPSLWLLAGLVFVGAMTSVFGPR
ncbi:MAG TPA: hypothetical protein VK139_00445 [Microbacteriaceae bacterium]|nr:hypothetical protein [Microbacteriaceae bacterium]